MSESWLTKIRGNQERDRRVTASHEADGWTVVRVPEHDLRTKAGLAQTADRIESLIVRQAG
jgi:DNA mismatch endonuclease (patch repair protein)